MPSRLMLGLRRPLPLIILVGATAMTLLAWLLTERYVQRKVDERFARRTQEAFDSVEARMRDYTEALQHIRGLFLADSFVSRDEFRRFVASMGVVERYPGIQGIGFTRRVAAAELEDYERRVRDEGFEDFAVWPAAPDRDEYFSIDYLEPFDWRNQRALGFDMYTEPVRRKAMERARFTGELAASGPLTLIQEVDVDKQVGFLLYLPVYADGAKLDTARQRYAALRGFVYSPFRTTDLFMGVFRRDAHNRDIDFRIYGETDSGSVLLFSGVFDLDPDFVREASLPLTLAGQQWRIDFHTLPAFLSPIERFGPPIVLVFGLLFSAVLFLFAGLDVGQREVERLNFRREQSLRLEAQQAAQTLDDFLSIASHELKTPVTSISLQLQLIEHILKEPNAGPGRLERHLGAAAKQVERLGSLIGNLLDLTRLQGGRFTLERERFNLAALVADVIEQFSVEIERAGYAVSFEAPKPVVGNWDRHRIEQVVVNLLTNAIKYGNARPISISVSATDQLACLWVRDHGLGIAAADCERIFERFERAEGATKASGLGLGLYIVKNILVAHGGDIRVKSRPGEGSTFTVTLPLGAGEDVKES